ncbi:hypothetical protein AWC23_24420 [Mycobacterium saskatchewanense]|uniref:Uncharacterized protein n=1 Tax=Mycobacterium saskatchewanense TaxID=220927 RepID=A0AAJ3NKX6_9MYCO|nr:hypothetical protein AWC23_24420 [Mycobacterium saskatchewanense]
MRAQLFDPRGEPVSVLRNREIGAYGDSVRVTAQLRAQLFQPVLPAGGDDHAVAAGHKLPGEFFTDA